MEKNIRKKVCRLAAVLSAVLVVLFGYWFFLNPHGYWQKKKEAEKNEYMDRRMLWRKSEKMTMQQMLSDMTLSWGAFCALLAFFLQFAGGTKLLRLLLGVKEAEANGVFFIPGTCPFVFILDGQLIATEAARDLLDKEDNHLEFILRNSWSKSYDWIYGNLLAFPALLRAFESILVKFLQ